LCFKYEDHVGTSNALNFLYFLSVYDAAILDAVTCPIIEVRPYLRLLVSYMLFSFDYKHFDAHPSIRMIVLRIVAMIGGVFVALQTQFSEDNFNLVSGRSVHIKHSVSNQTGSIASPTMDRSDTHGFRWEDPQFFLGYQRHNLLKQEG